VYTEHDLGVKMGIPGDRIRNVLSIIPGSAVELRYLVRKPAERLRLPTPKTDNRSNASITQQVPSEMLNDIRAPYATVIHVAARTGSRAGKSPVRLAAQRRSPGNPE
jgi:hypothetical protein